MNISKRLLNGTLPQYLLLFNNLFFIVLYLLLSYYNRASHDDLYFNWLAQDKGIINGTMLQYNSYCTRYFAVALNLFLSSFPLSSNVLLIYNAFLLLLFVLGFYLLLSHVKGLVNSSFWDKLNIALLLVSALFYATFKIGETWFWLSASSTYALSVAVLLLGLSKVFIKNTKWWHYPIMVICFAFVGGSNGTLSFFAITLAFIVLLFSKQIVLSRVVRNKLFFAASVCGFAFLVLFMGPGNAIRSRAFSNISIVQSVMLNFKMTGIICLLRIPKILPIVFGFASLLIFVLPLKKQALSHRDFIIKWLISTVGFGVLLFLFQWPITYKTQDVAAFRTLFPLVLVVYVYVVYVIWLIKNTFLRNWGNHNLLRLTFLGFLLLIQGSILIYQVPIVYQYAKAYDQRIVFLQSQNLTESLLYVDPLPVSGFLYSAEISTDFNNFTNQFLKMGLNLDANVALKTPSSYEFFK